jgi:deoxyribose-phosphate aldolase
MDYEMEEMNFSKIDNVSDVICLLDATSLGDLESLNDLTKDLYFLDKKYNSINQSSTFKHVFPAAMCVYPKWTRYIRTFLQKTGLKTNLATVINFPSGNGTVEKILSELDSVFFVDELDVVWNYHAWNCGKEDEAILPIKTVIEWAAKQVKKPLIKVILETAELEGDISKAVKFILSECSGKIHFMKTSTGKSPKGGATPDAVEAIVEGIKEVSRLTMNPMCGIKISGGINTLLDAVMYMELLSFLGWKITPQTTRFGSSKILKEIEN